MYKIALRHTMQYTHQSMQKPPKKKLIKLDFNPINSHLDLARNKQSTALIIL